MPFHDAPTAQQPGQPNGGRRVALVIGNGGYRHTTPLKNPANDATAIAAKLEALGFEVVGGAQDGVDLDYGTMAARIRDFGRQLRDNVGTALLFFAGHGLQVGGRNYLVPVDAHLQVEADVSLELVELQSILNQMERFDRTSIVLLDACRNNPLARNLARAMGIGDTRAAGITEGLAEQKVVAGTLIAYATQPGHVAYDGDGANGHFTAGLLDHIAQPGREVELMLKDVRAKVVDATKTKTQGPQVPWVHSSLMGSFYFKPVPATPPPPPETGTATVVQLAANAWAPLEATDDIERLELFCRHFPGTYYSELAQRRIASLKAAAAERMAEAKREREAAALAHRHAAEWQTAERENTIAAYERFLAAWTDGPHVAAARQKLAELKDRERAAAEARAQEERDRRESIPVRVGDGRNDRIVRLKPGETAPRDIDVGPEMVLVPPGKFWMGSKDSEGHADERPRHEVTIGYPLLVGKYPITFAEWDAAVIAGGVQHKPETTWGRGRQPVHSVSWDDAQAYAAWLSKATDKSYRLLFEAEWEYCCRAGTTSAYSFGDTISKQQAQFSEGEWGSAKQTVEVGKFPANAFGLHDMHGNVWEWCEDDWQDSYQGAPTNGSARTSAGQSVSRVLRGGSWLNDPQLLRSADRNWNQPGFRIDHVGFRLARTLSP
jgi:formylglycine-generating enzyme required for sulfatase activity